MEAMTIQLQGVRKVYQGSAPSLRGTKLEIQGPALWVANALKLVRPTASTTPLVVALADCTLSVASGEIFGIVGPNGSGKTTLMKILAGLLRPTAGMGQVAGVPLDDTRTIRRHVSYVSTTGWMGLEWALTAEENLHFFARLSGMPTALAKRRSDEALHALDLWADRSKSVSALSNGMRQRIIMARALLWHTPVVLLDEPLVGLDPHHRHALLQVIEGLAQKREQTVVISDHDAEAVATLAGRVLLLAEGQVAGYGTVSDLVKPLHGHQIVDLVTIGCGAPDGVPPKVVSRVVRRPRPGPLGEVHWQITVNSGPDALMKVIAWLESSGVTITELSERDPSLQDVLAADALSTVGQVTA